MTVNPNAYAVIIGINKYIDSSFQELRFAEKDAQDIYNALTSDKSIFPKENVRLLKGEQATTKQISAALYKDVVRDRKKGDIVLVYFSGHGFLDETLNIGYIGTQDTDLHEVQENPKTGLSMDELYNNYFSEQKSQADWVIFILDCCHSGAVVPTPATGSKSAIFLTTNIPPDKGLVKSDYFSGGQKRIAILSSPRGVASRESAQKQNGLFTYYFVKGLVEGACDNNGDVTIDSLLAYIRANIYEQPTIRYGYDQKFVLATTGKPIPSPKVYQADYLSGFLSREFNLEFISNPLDFCQKFIDALLEKFQCICEGEGGVNIEQYILNSIREIFNGEFVFILHFENGEAITKYCSEYPQGYNTDMLIQIAAGINERATKGQSVIGQNAFLYNYEHLLANIQSKSSDKSAQASKRNRMLIIPMKGSSNDNIVISGLPEDALWVNDVSAIILRSIYSSTLGFNSIVSLEKLEEDLLDSLHFTFNFLPIKLYDKRFDLFSKSVENLTVHFQPIFYLHPTYIHICGWEALARDKSSGNLPFHLFRVAEQWGPRFCIELDRYILLNAAKVYKTSRDSIRGLRRSEDIKDLSINVYPQSLMRSAYYEAFNEILKQDCIPPENIVLEISEKCPIPDEASDYTTAVEAFRKQLLKYVKNYHIKFAIDDFGLGYGSLSRLIGLEPNYIKVDRSILVSDHSELTLSYLLNLLQGDNIYTSKIVVEGFDARTRNITLKDLYRIGIRYVQGYLLGEISPTLYTLSKETRKNLYKMLGSVKTVPEGQEDRNSVGFFSNVENNEQ